MYAYKFSLDLYFDYRCPLPEDFCNSILQSPCSPLTSNDSMGIYYTVFLRRFTIENLPHNFCNVPGKVYTVIVQHRHDSQQYHTNCQNILSQQKPHSGVELHCLTHFPASGHVQCWCKRCPYIKQQHPSTI